MSVKTTVKKQYQAMVDQTATRNLRQLNHPPEGWIATVRKALGLSAAQLGRLVERTRANISAAERSEQQARATLRTMNTLAEAMGCKFVYAFVPKDGRIEDVFLTHARKKARAIVTRASTHMALEQQALTQEQLEDQIETLADELLRNPPPDFWGGE